MGEIRKIVTEHYPVDQLPEAVRRGIERGQLVRVTVEFDRDQASPPRSLRSFLGTGRGLYSSPEEVVEYIRKLRDEWD